MYLVVFKLLTICVISTAIRIRATYTKEAPYTVPNGIYQEITNTVYLDARATNQLTEPQYILSIDEVSYRPELNEKELESFYNFRNLKTFSMVKNGQKKIPNFRNLARLKLLVFKETEISFIDSNSISNVPVEVVDLQRNKINTIEKGAFGKRVHSVDLKCNNLTVLASNWFKNATGLRWFNAESNKIEKLQVNLFKKFKNLQELYLARNEIITLEPGSLSGPPNMFALDLGTNHISIIEGNVFSNQTIENLRISFNRISYLKQDLFDRLKIVGKSYINGNPWQCHCVKAVRDWLSETYVKYIMYHEATCTFTDNISPYCEENVNLNDELYNMFVSSLDVVDTRECVNDPPSNENNRRKDLQFGWEYNYVDLGKKYGTENL